MERNVLVQILVEVERRDRMRNLSRFLRDVNDPFFVPEESFRKTYRLSRQAARDVFQEILPRMERGRRATRTPSVVRFMVSLHFFAQGSYQKSVGKDQHCAVSQSVVSKSLKEVTNLLVEIAPRYIQFPRDMQEAVAVKAGFYEKFGFPGIEGCIDGTHILIFPPPAEHPVHPGRVYVNRKNSHSINCQLICDSNLKILNINARFPGSVHDSAVWMMSNVKEIMRNNHMQGDRTTWLLGDSGYPLAPFLLTPIIGAEDNTPEGRYNKAHIRARNCVERCIGLLKSYFRCLLKDRVLHYSPEVAGKIIYSCAVLHNILRIRNIENDEINIVYDNENYNNEELEYEEHNLLHEGRITRNNLILQHFQ
ncbi:putative nuclease HARBI1 [Zophobas morio]|uniref:putative nuclease HARBI1 n=1 Tax=Zophobas morio TaxID=2755281 RepID=UPI003083D346